MKVAPLAATAPGALLFARYAIPPNLLGFCGPADSAELLDAVRDGSDPSLVVDLERRFDGAWPYLELIAGSNGIGDPLDRRVVEAYWVGNELVERVPGRVMWAELGERFSARAGRRLGPLLEAVPRGGVPQHNFHVFAVYPWVGLLRGGGAGGAGAGAVAAALEVLDRCRIRWGTVESASGDRVTVQSRLLAFEGSRLVLGEARSEHAQAGLSAGRLSPGDVVSLHWDWVCDRLSPSSLRWLRLCTRRNLEAVNACAVPGPAVAAERG